MRSISPMAPVTKFLTTKECRGVMPNSRDSASSSRTRRLFPLLSLEYLGARTATLVMPKRNQTRSPHQNVLNKKQKACYQYRNNLCDSESWGCVERRRDAFGRSP